MQIHTSKSVSNATLLSVLGRLENVAMVVQPLGHFLNNIRSLQMKAEKSVHNIPIPPQVKQDINLARKFLTKAHEGISMNLMTFRSPDLFFIGDASEHGMGGFDTNGRAWRFHIPEELQGRAHINLLEFLTQLIGIWIAIDEGSLKEEDCILAMGDSTTALGWLRRSNFRDKDENTDDWKAKQMVARKLGELTLESNIVLYKQWFRGKDNVVADSLSRDLFYLSPSSHTSFLNLTAKNQLPRNFQIQPVPTRISSFILSVLQLLPVNQQRWKAQNPSELARGNTGILSSILLASKTHRSLQDVLPFNKTSSSPHLLKQSEKVLTLQELQDHWWREQSKPPRHMWLRLSGQTIGRTPDWTLMEEHVSSSQNNCEPIEILMGHARNKKHSQ